MPETVLPTRYVSVPVEWLMAKATTLDKVADKLQGYGETDDARDLRLLAEDMSHKSIALKILPTEGML